jgi:hypothetical protein
MIRQGTSHFVSLAKAAMYYRDYEGGDGYATARRKLSVGEIHIGPPEQTKQNQRLVIIDNGTRYAIEEDE